MQVWFFTGVMRKVDWHRHRKLAVVVTPSLDTLSIPVLPSSTGTNRRGRVQGEEHASFGRAVTLQGPTDDRAQMDSPDISTQTATGTCGERATDARGGKGMTARI